jgi:hypothetical protein
MVSKRAGHMVRIIFRCITSKNKFNLALTNSNIYDTISATKGKKNLPKGKEKYYGKEIERNALCTS